MDQLYVYGILELLLLLNTSIWTLSGRGLMVSHLVMSTRDRRKQPPTSATCLV